MGKLQTPTPKLQRSPKFQAANPAPTLPSFCRIAQLFCPACRRNLVSTLTLGSCCLVLYVGCSVGPNYKRPQVESPTTFRGDGSPTNTSFADLQWWDVYQDATLQALVREAFTNNYDLRIAFTR